ncbi:hypothetical protein GSI_10516 [Ganoderma sinense ZZ0214-1]|uniref:DUF6533 domain-containing protein n=1 Tax=Ganoderma sinense ZZ0214-1 TaxID=1077348 RepID=A0A2G8S0R9_9APHY|nr:hypothetical protein GSI_10516 [Ganoderma sinense ZZ0214-1]
MANIAPDGINLTHTFIVQSSGGLNLLRTTKYIKLASATLLLLEMISTFPDEVSVNFPLRIPSTRSYNRTRVDLVWPNKFGFAKATFLFNKYSPFLDEIVDFMNIFNFTGNVQLCVKRYNVLSWFYFTGVLQSEIILLSRTVAFWGWNRPCAYMPSTNPTFTYNFPRNM